MRDQDICGDDVKGSIASFIREGYFIFYYLTIKLRAVCPVVFNPKVYSGFKRRREEKLYIRINLIRLIISVISLIGLFSGIVSYLIILDLSFIDLSYKMGIYVPSQFYFSYFDVNRRCNNSQIVRLLTKYPNLLDSNFSKISKSNYM